MQDDLNPIFSPRLWRSQVTFTADSSGTVDLGSDAPQTGGSYTGAEKMGPFYSMRLVGQETQSPFGFNKFSAAPTEYTFSAVVGGVAVATATFEQQYMATGVKGVLYLPPAQVPAVDSPSVITVTGSDGGLGLQNENRAALFASHGYASLVLPYFNYPGLPSTLANIPLEYFENAIDWMEARSDTTDFTAFAGASRGGELALLAGATFPQIDAVIASAPSGVEWPSVPSDISVVEPAWTLGGDPVPYVDESLSRDDLQSLMDANNGTGNIVPLTPYFEDALAADPNASSAEIAVENTNGPILMLSGKDDQLWPSEDLGNIAKERLANSSTYNHFFRHHRYDGAGHILLVPNLPTTYDHYLAPPPYDNYLGIGVEPKANHDANRQAWGKTLEFLSDAVAAS
ncbi:acyl-CoA thioesterase/bile acid-CoA:amino acid N-acyltransferase family protein [Actinokineospora sp. 24-640]